MSTFRQYSVQCVCRHVFRAELAVAVNPVRMPELRKAILNGSLHRLTCPQCGRMFTVEKRFLYLDLERGSVIHVHPPNESYRWRQASAELDTDLAEIETHGVADKPSNKRVVFGIGELRDKLVAQDAKLDDRHIELAKVLALHEHPILLHRPRLRLFLNQARSDRIEFFAGYDHAQQAFTVSVPRFSFDRLASGNTAQTWVKNSQQANLFDQPSDHWVSVRRWAPSNAVTDTLHTDAETVRAGQDIDLDSQDFKVMLANLPHGSQLTNSAKVDLRDIEKYAKSENRPDIEQALFKVRFGFDLDDEWGLNRETGDIDTLWDLLKDLPDTNVEGNAYIHEVILKPGDGGGLYNPSSDDIEVTADPTSGDSFQNEMRHEVGHAVQQKLDTEKNSLVTNFLRDQFGWQAFPGTADGARQWVDLMDGWDNIAEADKPALCDTLVQGLGPGSSWSPPPAPNPPASSPWWRPDFGPRLALSGSLANWYSSNNKWYPKNGRAYFLNYWYDQFMVVNLAVLDFINNKMPWDYAAMSPSEFFAELYALYYRLDAADRPNIDQAIRAWFDTNVGAPRANAPAPPPPQANA
jgi:hypothetical protein